MNETAHMAKARTILHAHEQFMKDRLNALMPQGVDGISVLGEWPVWRIDAPRFDGTEDPVQSRPFQLQYRIAGTTGFSFRYGIVNAGSYFVVPTIGGVPVGSVDGPSPNDPALPKLGGGGQVFAKYTWALDPLKTAPDWADEFISCELVQVRLIDPPPPDTLPYTGVTAGVDPSRGVCHGFLMAYDAQGRAMTYGQSQIIDPDDTTPGNYTVQAFPLVRYVA